MFDILLNAIIPAVQAQGNDGFCMPFGHPLTGGWGSAGSMFMIIFWLLAIIGILLLVRYLVKGNGHTAGRGHTGKSSLDIIKERYARGEIDKREYDEKKKDLA